MEPYCRIAETSEASINDDLTRALATEFEGWFMAPAEDQRDFPEWCAPHISDALDAALEVMKLHCEGDERTLHEAREAFVRSLNGGESEAPVDVGAKAIADLRDPYGRAYISEVGAAVMAQAAGIAMVDALTDEDWNEIRYVGWADGLGVVSRRTVMLVELKQRLGLTDD